MSLLKEFSKKERVILIIVFIFSILLTILGFVMDAYRKDEEVLSFRRPEAYEEEKEVNFLLKYKEDEEEKTLDYSGVLGERKLLEEEQEKVLMEALDRVEKTMFREGEDYENVKTGLFIPERLEGNPASISWETENGEIFDGSGNINFQKMGIEPIETKLSIKAEYEDREEVREYQIKIHPYELTKGEKEIYLIKKELDKVLESSESEEALLPKKIGDKEVRYITGKKEVSPLLSGMGFLTLFLLYFYFKNRNEKKKIKREEELKEAYPYFVGRFVVLLGAGLNISNIWKRLEKTENFNESLNREIRLTLWEIGNGKVEREAYENFGKRIGGMQYPKFISILTENLKMGSSQILSRLSSEAKDAMVERRNQVKEMGEKMGTKLLLPMMVELLLIMLIIMLPAMMSVGK